MLQLWSNHFVLAFYSLIADFTWEEYKPLVMDIGKSIFMALAVFIIGKWLAKFLIGILKKVLTRAKIDDMLIAFLANLGYWLLLILVIIAAAGELGIDTTSFTAIIAAAGLAVGFALKDSLANFAAGVMLIIFKPFKLGDFIDASGCSGTVEEIHMFCTIMRTSDNIKLIVPNGELASGTIKNFSANETRRIDLVVGCGYDDDLKAVKQFLIETLAADERILQDPAPVVAVNELGDSSVNFVVRPWVKRGDYGAVRWDLTEAIKVGFDAKGFSIPYPSQDIYVHNQS